MKNSLLVHAWYQGISSSVQKAVKVQYNNNNNESESGLTIAALQKFTSIFTLPWKIIILRNNYNIQSSKRNLL